MVILQNKSLFIYNLKRGLFSQRRLFGQASMPWPSLSAHRGCVGHCYLPMGPWLRALAMEPLPMGAVLSLAMWLCHSDFPMGAVMALRACMWVGHGLGNLSMRATLTLAACLLKGYFLKWESFFPKDGFFFFFPFSNEVIWEGHHYLALATCPLGVCKKPKNWKNRMKPTEPCLKFRFGFDFHFSQTEVSISISIPGMYAPNRPKPNWIIYFIL